MREAGSRSIRPHKKTEEEEELDEFVNFERYRDLIKHRRRGCRYLFSTFSSDNFVSFFHLRIKLKGKKNDLRIKVIEIRVTGIMLHTVNSF